MWLEYLRIIAKRNKYENVKESFSQKGCSLISSSYINSKTLLDYTCICGNLAKISYSNFLSGKLCKSCGIRKQAKSLKLNQEDVFSIIRKHDYTIISPKYVGAKFKLDLICSKKHVIQCSYRSLRQNNFGCKKCSIIKMTGVNSPLYKHGLSKEDRLDRNKSKIFHNEWKRKLLIKFNFQCDYCGLKAVGKNLVAHHLNGYNWAVTQRYDIDNGILLCKKCHDKFHLKYGKGNNTISQYIELKSA